MKANRINEKKFNRLTGLTIIAVYLVILAGGIVRSTGSGMGCPDWPKCFGSWVPPTSEAQLPADYQQRFAQIRVNKNQRLAGYLETLGFKSLSQAIQGENIAAPEAVFNKYKTWTEYVNRLLGVLVGFLITIMVVASVKFRKIKPPLFFGSIAAFLLVVFQGWIGSVVVSTNLLPGLITFHMGLAALLIGVLIYLYHICSNEQIEVYQQTQSKRIRIILVASILMFSFQIAVGSQVREAVDVIALRFDRDQWISNLGGTYYLHRTFSLILLALCGYLVVLLRQTNRPSLTWLTNLLIGFLAIEIVLGIVMGYFSVPAWAQPVHLLMALMILGLQYWLYLKTKNLQMI